MQLTQLQRTANQREVCQSGLSRSQIFTLWHFFAMTHLCDDGPKWVFRCKIDVFYFVVYFDKCKWPLFWFHLSVDPYICSSSRQGRTCGGAGKGRLPVLSRPQFLCCLQSKLAGGIMFWDPDIFPWTLYPMTYSLRTFFSGQFPSLFTWCRTFPPFHHHHPPIYNIKPYTVNMYKIDSGRSIRVRMIPIRIFLH